MKRVYHYLIGALFIAAGLFPSWNWSLTHDEWRIGTAKSPLVVVTLTRVRDPYGRVVKEASTRDIDFCSVSGGFILAGLLVMGIGSRRDEKNKVVHSQPPVPPTV